MPVASNDITEQKLLYETRSEEVQEIMGRMPSWMLRYGIILIGIILCLLIFGAYFIKYPDKVSARVDITSDNPPVRVIAEKGGRIKNVYVKQNDSVDKGTILLVLDNTANHYDVTLLKNFLLQELQNEPNVITFPKNQYQLGELQSQYEDLLVSIEDLHFFLNNDNSYLSVAQLEKQIQENNKLYNQLETNETRANENASIDQKDFETSQLLFKKNAITESDYLQAKKKWLDQQTNLNANKNNMISNTLKASELRKNIIDIKQQKEKTLFESNRKVVLGIKTLLQQIDEWERVNIIKSPIAGHINLYSIWKENQYIQAGQSIMLIVPSVQNIIAKGMIPISSSGKVKIGQTILINLLSHPQNEYGYVEGTVSYVSAAPLDSVYSFDIKLKNGLHTTASKAIFPQPQMYGNGEILTDDKNELVRMFESLKK